MTFRLHYFFLSNFYPAPVKLDGETYSTVEHAYQAAKTLDLRQRRQIREALLPDEAKRIGRRVTMRSGWNAMRLAVMEQLLIQKFADPKLREQLRATGSSELVEDNGWGDTFWGRCAGRGENHLGRLLMKVRAL